MPELFLKYYFDVTKYNILVAFLVAFVSLNLRGGILSFGTFGMVISLFIYKYYKDIEYYFYLNAGLTKSRMMVGVFAVNFIIFCNTPRNSVNHTLDVEAVSHAFGKKSILSDIGFSCKTGDTVGIFGRNGTGKSTLLKILFGTIKAKQSIIKVDTNL